MMKEKRKKRNSKKSDGDKEVTLVEHLAELRRRLIICAITVFLCFFPCYLQIKEISRFLIKPVGKLVFIAPHEAFITYLKLALITGVFIALPMLLYQIWSYVAVGLRKNERKYLLIYGPFSLILFVGGALFAYYLILPLGIGFLLGFASESLQAMISFSKYVSFAGMLLMAFGVVFELPLVIMFLTKIRIVTPKYLRKQRRYAILLIFLVAALLTPPDAVTQVMMAGPMIVLYEISILLSSLIYRKRKLR